MSDQVELLKDLRHHEREYQSLVHGPLCGRAAAEIASLRAQLASARKALEGIADMATDLRLVDRLGKIEKCARAALT